MFPLGSTLLPGMPLPLRVFEPRYLQMMQELIDGDEPEFGVVLIERGHEVGGGETRFDIGTLARVRQVEVGGGMLGVLASGVRRFNVTQWLPDEPYPRAEIEVIDDLVWDDAHLDLLATTEATVRRIAAAAVEFVDSPFAPDVELDDDPLTRSWQLAGIAHLGPHDKVALLEATSVEDLLTDIARRTEAAWEFLQLSQALSMEDAEGPDGL